MRFNNNHITGIVLLAICAMWCAVIGEKIGLPILFPAAIFMGLFGVYWFLRGDMENKK